MHYVPVQLVEGYPLQALMQQAEVYVQANSAYGQNKKKR